MLGRKQTYTSFTANDESYTWLKRQRTYRHRRTHAFWMCLLFKQNPFDSYLVIHCMPISTSFMRISCRLGEIVHIVMRSIDLLWAILHILIKMISWVQRAGIVHVVHSWHKRTTCLLSCRGTTRWFRIHRRLQCLGRLLQRECPYNSLRANSV